MKKKLAVVLAIVLALGSVAGVSAALGVIPEVGFTLLESEEPYERPALRVSAALEAAEALIYEAITPTGVQPLAQMAAQGRPLAIRAPQELPLPNNALTYWGAETARNLRIAFAYTPINQHLGLDVYLRRSGPNHFTKLSLAVHNGQIETHIEGRAGNRILARRLIGQGGIPFSMGTATQLTITMVDDHLSVMQNGVQIASVVLSPNDTPNEAGQIAFVGPAQLRYITLAAFDNAVENQNPEDTQLVNVRATAYGVDVEFSQPITITHMTFPVTAAGSFIAVPFATTTTWPGQGAEHWRRIASVGPAAGGTITVYFDRAITTRYLRIEGAVYILMLQHIRVFNDPSIRRPVRHLGTAVATPVPQRVRANSVATNENAVPNNVLTNNPAQFWHSRWASDGTGSMPNQFPYFLEIDFGRVVAIYHVALTHRHAWSLNGRIHTGFISYHPSAEGIWPGSRVGNLVAENVFLPMNDQWRRVAQLGAPGQPFFTASHRDPQTHWVVFDQPIFTRYLRLEITGGYGGYATLGNFRAYSGPAIQVVRDAASMPGHPAVNLLLESPHLYWHTRQGQLPAFVDFDFGAITEVRQIALCKRTTSNSLSGRITGGNILTARNPLVLGTSPNDWEHVASIPPFTAAPLDAQTILINFDEPLFTKYLRLEVTGGFNDFAALSRVRFFSEITLTPPPLPPDATEIVSVRANSWTTNDGALPQHVLNTNTSLYWHTRWSDSGPGGGLAPGQFPFFLELDLGEVRTVRQVHLTHRNAGGLNGRIHAGYISVHHQTDNLSATNPWPGAANFLTAGPASEWLRLAPIPAFTAGAWHPQVMTITLPNPVATRFLRLEITEGFGGYATLANVRVN